MSDGVIHYTDPSAEVYQTLCGLSGHTSGLTLTPIAERVNCIACGRALAAQTVRSKLPKPRHP